MQRPFQGYQSVVFLGGFLGSDQAILVFLGVLELETIHRGQFCSDFRLHAFIEKQLEPPPGIDAQVMLTLRANIHVAVQFGPIHHPVAAWALAPQPLGNAVAPVFLGAAYCRQDFSSQLLLLMQRSRY